MIGSAATSCSPLSPADTMAADNDEYFATFEILLRSLSSATDKDADEETVNTVYDNYIAPEREEEKILKKSVAIPPRSGSLYSAISVVKQGADSPNKTLIHSNSFRKRENPGGNSAITSNSVNLALNPNYNAGTSNLNTRDDTNDTASNTMPSYFSHLKPTPQSPPPPRPPKLRPRVVSSIESGYSVKAPPRVFPQKKNKVEDVFHRSNELKLDETGSMAGLILKKSEGEKRTQVYENTSPLDRQPDLQAFRKLGLYDLNHSTPNLTDVRTRNPNRDGRYLFTAFSQDSFELNQNDKTVTRIRRYGTLPTERPSNLIRNTAPADPTEPGYETFNKANNAVNESISNHPYESLIRTTAETFFSLIDPLCFNKHGILWTPILLKPSKSRNNKLEIYPLCSTSAYSLQARVGTCVKVVVEMDCPPSSVFEILKNPSKKAWWDNNVRASKINSILDENMSLLTLTMGTGKYQEKKVKILSYAQKLPGGKYLYVQTPLKSDMDPVFKLSGYWVTPLVETNGCRVVHVWEGKKDGFISIGKKSEAVAKELVTSLKGLNVVASRDNGDMYNLQYSTL